jgi:hypothetical protein
VSAKMLFAYDCQGRYCQPSLTSDAPAPSTSLIFWPPKYSDSKPRNS